MPSPGQWTRLPGRRSGRTVAGRRRGWRRRPGRREVGPASWNNHSQSCMNVPVSRRPRPASLRWCAPTLGRALPLWPPVPCEAAASRGRGTLGPLAGDGTCRTGRVPCESERDVPGQRRIGAGRSAAVGGAGAGRGRGMRGRVRGRVERRPERDRLLRLRAGRGRGARGGGGGRAVRGRALPAEGPVRQRGGPAADERQPPVRGQRAGPRFRDGEPLPAGGAASRGPYRLARVRADDQHRVRDLRADPQPVGPGAHRRGLLGRRGGRRRRRHRARPPTPATGADRSASRLPAAGSSVSSRAAPGFRWRRTRAKGGPVSRSSTA